MEKIFYRFAYAIIRNFILLLVYNVLLIIYLSLLAYFTIIRDPFFWQSEWTLFFAFIWPAFIIVPSYIWNTVFLFKIFKLTKKAEKLEEDKIKKIEKYFKFLFIVAFWGKKSQEKLEKKSIKQKERLEKISGINPLFGLLFPIYWIIFYSN
ncbi:hypothetical protein [Mycoplasma sp. Z386]